MRSVVEIHQTFVSEVDLVSEVAYWILSTVCVEAASVQQLGVRSLDAVNFLLVDQRPGVFIRLIDCWVFRFNAECSEMRHVRW